MSGDNLANQNSQYSHLSEAYTFYGNYTMSVFCQAYGFHSNAANYVYGIKRDLLWPSIFHYLRTRGVILSREFHNMTQAVLPQT